MSQCNAIRQFSHLPTIFYQWGECVRVFVFKSSSVQTAPYLIWEHGFRIRYVVFMIEEIVVEYRFQKVVQSKGSHILSWKCGRVMWEHKCRIHHIFFMSEDSVLEYRFKKVDQSRRSRHLFLKMWPCDAITRFSHPPHFFISEHNVSEYVLPCNVRTHISHPPLPPPDRPSESPEAICFRTRSRFYIKTPGVVWCVLGAMANRSILQFTLEKIIRFQEPFISV